MLKSIISNEKFVVIHSSLKKFNNSKEFVNTFLNEINNYSNITFLFPCFNYDFLKTGVYEFETSESQVGQLCNIIKDKYEYIKSNSPVFPFIIIGPNKQIFLNCDDSNSFGSNSLFDLLIQNKKEVLYIHLNCLSFTHIHYWEQNYKVPYRYNKQFSGKYIKNNKSSNYILNYNVRNLNLNPESIGEMPNEQFLNITKYNYIDYMGGKIYYNNLYEIDKNITNTLAKDIYSLILNKEDIINKINLEGYAIYKNIEKLYPMCRSITGEDILKTR
jgi:aminoglycoside 3-N-acetyltransferase